MTPNEEQELNAKIAEYVMGWKRVHSDRDEGDDKRDVAWMLHSTGVLKGEPYSFPSMNGMYDRSYGKWFPSTDIAAAMEVVEKMRVDGWSFACTLYEGKLPYASFCKQTVASSRNAEADTLPTAICRAALAAVENQ